MEYSIWTFFGLLVTVGPAIGALYFPGTVDRYPSWIALGAGAAVSAAMLAQRFSRRNNDDRDLVGEIARKAAEGAFEGRRKNRKALRRQAKAAESNASHRTLEPANSKSADEQALENASKDPARAGRALFKRTLRYMGPPLWSFSVLIFSNQWLDTSRSVNHEVVFHKRIEPYKGPASIHVSSWRTTLGAEVIREQSHIMNANVEPGERLIVTTREGFFGWEWIESVRPAPPSSSTQLPALKTRPLENPAS